MRIGRPSLTCAGITALLAFGCTQKDSGDGTSVEQNHVDSASVDGTSNSVRAPRSALSGVQLVVDSAARDPRIEISGSDYVIRLPEQIAATLFDSLPQFNPLPRSAYDTTLVKWVDANDSAAAPLSVVIGDFDGNGRKDIALIGVSRDSVAKFMLLAASSGNRGPRLIHLVPQQLATPQYPESLYFSPLYPSRLSNGFDLRTDGIKFEAFEKGETLYYLDREGRLQHLDMSED
jgi:hypothetical protein